MELDVLNSSYQELKAEYDTAQLEITKLKDLTITLLIATLTFAATTVYFDVRNFITKQ